MVLINVWANKANHIVQPEPKGKEPARSAKQQIAAANRSTWLPRYGSPAKISGALYIVVPHYVCKRPEPVLPASGAQNPKSMTFKLKLLSSMIFSSFRSRCMMP